MNVYTQWKKYLEKNQPTAVDMAAYAIARSLNAEQPLEKALNLLYAGFSPIKNKNRLLNGEFPYSTLETVIGQSSGYPWNMTARHNILKRRLFDLFEIEDNEELTEFLLELSKNIDLTYSKPYSYVVVRKDLEDSVKVVQSCHAIQEVTMEYPDQHKNTHMIVLQVPSQAELLRVETILKRYKNIKFHMFNESDNDLGYTALATSPITNRYLRSVFANYQLLK